MPEAESEKTKSTRKSPIILCPEKFFNSHKVVKDKYDKLCKAKLQY
jgi:hypothetical protein